MERFNLNTWLEDKRRKIVTRDGKPARIICYDVKQGNDDCYVPIIALVDKGEEIGEMSYYYSEDGSFLRNPNQTHNLDLFFEDEEERLTDFEKAVEKIMPYKIPIDMLKSTSQQLLELARKEIEKENPYNGNQKQEWSEEDEKLYISALWHIKNSCGNGGKDNGEYEVYNWLKSLKDRVQPQPKQEWSEEDKSMYIRTLGILGKCYMGELPTKVEEELKWFKSIEPKSHWKPSEEQMEALFEAKLASINNREYFLGLLYEDLKKL